VTVANLFFAQVFKLHDLPHTIISDRDVVFTSFLFERIVSVAGS
jgi:hypothetical protein